MNLLIKSQSATLETTEEYAHSQRRAARGAAVGAENAPIDPDLQSIIERWPNLSETVKASIMAIVKPADDTQPTS